MNLRESDIDIITLLEEQRMLMLKMVELYGVLEFALPTIDPKRLLSKKNQVRFSSHPPSSTDSHWHQDGSTTEAPTEAYKIGLLWPEEKPRISGSTEIVPVAAFAEAAETGLGNRSQSWSDWSSFTDLLVTMCKERKSLQRSNKKSDYREFSIESVRDVIYNSVISCEREKTDALITAQLTQKNLPVHRVEYQSPTFSIFSNRNTFHRRNGPQTKFGSNANDTIFRANILENAEQQAAPSIWSIVRERIAELIP